MEQIITAKLKLQTTPEQHTMLRQTQLAYRDALNYISIYAFDQGKISNERRLHKGTYYDIRSKFKLPSEMTNNAIRKVGSIYKGLWTKVKKTINIFTKKLRKNATKVWINHPNLSRRPSLIIMDMIIALNLIGK